MGVWVGITEGPNRVEENKFYSTAQIRTPISYRPVGSTVTTLTEVRIIIIDSDFG
jgi:hypothetical protein